MTQKHKGNERKNVFLQAITIKLTKKIMKLKQTITLVLAALSLTTAAQERRRGFQREAYATEAPMVHDPVMAREGDTYY